MAMQNVERVAWRMAVPSRRACGSFPLQDREKWLAATDCAVFFIAHLLLLWCLQHMQLWEATCKTDS